MSAIRSPYSPAPESRLQAAALDVHLLQRQLVLILTDDAPGGGGDTLALMAACCLCDRLAEGRALLTGSRSAFARYFDDAGRGAGRLHDLMRGDVPPAPAAGGELLYDPDLVRGLGLQRIRRLQQMDSVAARVAREVLLAAGLFLAAAAPAPVRHEPDFHPAVFAPVYAGALRLTA